MAKQNRPLTNQEGPTLLDLQCPPKRTSSLQNGRLSLAVLTLLLAVAACSSSTKTTPTADIAADQATTDALNPVDSFDSSGDLSPDTTANADTATDAVPQDSLTGDASADATDEILSDDADVADTAVADADAQSGSDIDDALPGTDAATTETYIDIAVDTGPIVKASYPLACATTADCNFPCASGVCLAGQCSLTAKNVDGCMVLSGDGQVQCLPAGASSDATACLVCAPSVSKSKLSSTVTNDKCEGDASQYSIVDTYKSGITWNISDKRSVSGSSLYFGDPTTRVYDNGKKVAGTVTLPAFTIPDTAGAGAKIAFWLWLDTEQTKGSDVLSVLVSDGTLSQTVWTSDAIVGSTGGKWQQIVVDAKAWATKSVTVTFAFDSIDAVLNNFEGAYIDNVAVQTGCCADAKDCDDGNACTTDSCSNSGGSPVCNHAILANCCSSASDCNDNKACTLDLCPVVGGPCQHSDLPGCCTGTAECDDKNDCTIDSCQSNACAHVDTCCKSDAQCVSGDPNQLGSCIGGNCSYSIIGCSKDADCDDFNTCTQDACSASKCVHTASSAPGCCAPTLISNSFASSVEGWTADAGSQGLTWDYKDFASAKTLPGALHFGLASGAINLQAGAPTVKSVITSPPITVLTGKETQLALQVWADLSGFSIANLRIFTVVDGKEATLSTIQASQVLGSWHPFLLDLTPVGGRTIQITFEITIQASGWSSTTGQGIWIDEVQATSTCQPKKCASSGSCGTAPFACIAGTCANGVCGYSNSCCATNADCDDLSVCTADACVNNHCQFSAIAQCCVGNGDCNDNDACTADSCPSAGAQCVYSPILGCCKTNANCNDNNACTVDTCAANKCTNLNTCCSSDAECNDGETKCTIDTCVAQKCNHKPTGAAGCCVPTVFTNSFDTGDLLGMTISNQFGASKGWQINGNSKQSKSPSGTLWYGDPATGNYDFGGQASNGAATTAAILLPATTASALDLWLYMDTEGGTSYDALEIAVVSGGQSTTVFTKNQVGFNTGAWFELKVDLTKWEGQEITLKFTFNTGDGIANSGSGVFIDDLKITTNCGN